MTTRIFNIIFCLLFKMLVSGQQKKSTFDWTEYNNQIQKADSLFQNKEYLNSAKAYSKAFITANGGFLENHKYQAALSWAFAGEKDSAINNLRQEIVLLNFYNYDKLIRETGFTILHNSNEWDDLKQKVKDNLENENKKYGKYAEVKNKLEEIWELDQKYRTHYMDVWKKFGYESSEMKNLEKKINEQDKSNLEYVTKVIGRYGWLSFDTIGYKANQTLFLVIQHSDSATQEEYLPILRVAVKEKKAFGHQLALLEDRLLIRQGKIQIFGSQIKCDSIGNNCWILPIEDEKNVDNRRAEIGLPPLEDYVKAWNIAYKKPN